MAPVFARSLAEAMARPADYYAYKGPRIRLTQAQMHVLWRGGKVSADGAVVELVRL